MNSKTFCLLSFFIFSVPTAVFGNSHHHNAPAKNVQFRGLRNITPERIYPHLPIEMDQSIHFKNIDLIIKRLYATGFFDTIKVLEGQRGHITIEVTERPVIKQITLKTERLNEKIIKPFLEQYNIKVGEFFSLPSLHSFEKELQKHEQNNAQYQNLINIKVIPVKNQDQVTIEIHLPPHKGILKFSEIYIRGNHAFNERELLSTLPVSNNPFKAFLTNKTVICHPSIQQMALETLKNFYKNKGYLEVDFITKTSITADHKAAYWIIEIKEGPLYKIGEYKIICPPELDTSILHTCIPFKKGQPYSQEIISKTEDLIKDKLDSVSSNVQIIPSINPKQSIVDFTIKIDSIQSTYVRKLHILGNHYIQDQTIRRLCQQPEAALLSRRNLNISETRLNQSGFSNTPITIYPIPIPGSHDQVDLILKIDENTGNLYLNPGEIAFGIDKWQFGISGGMDNVLGTGIKGDIHLNKSQQDYTLSFSYDHPYHTLDGIRRTVKFHFLSRQPIDFLREQFPGVFILEKPITKLFSTISQNANEYVLHPFSESVDQYIFQPVSNGWNLYVSPMLAPILSPLSILTTEVSHESNEVSRESNESTEETKKIEISKYELNECGLALKYGIPFNQKGDVWTFEIGPKISQIRLPKKEQAYSNEIQAFLDRHKNNLWEIPVTIGMHIMRLTGDYFPYKGFYSQLTLKQSFLWTDEWYFYPYFKFNFSGAAYHQFKPSITQKMSVGLRWKIGYGSSLKQQTPELPFFENYHSEQIRGFADNSLGPKDSLDRQLGANFMFNGSIILCAPKPLRGDHFRCSIFCDVGSVNNITGIPMLRTQQIIPRLAVGLSLDTIIPMPMFGNMPLNLSIAKPIWYQKEDKKQLISIAIRSSFL